METITIEAQGLAAIDAVLKDWEDIYFQPFYEQQRLALEQANLVKTIPEWNYYTKHVSTTTTQNPDSAHFVTIFSQPTAEEPVPKATASIYFSFSKDKGLSFHFETGKLIHTVHSVPILGNPAKRLGEIVLSKEQTAHYFSSKISV
jgi:hypothetical protein